MGVGRLFVFSLVLAGLCGPDTALAGLSSNCQLALEALANNPHRDELSRYEAISILRREAPHPQDYIERYTPQTGIFVTKRNAQGNATEGIIRELIDNDHADVRVIGPFNKLGTWRHQSVSTPSRPRNPLL